MTKIELERKYHSLSNQDRAALCRTARSTLRKSGQRTDGERTYLAALLLLSNGWV